MPTPKSGNRTEPAIYISVLQTLTRQTEDILHAIYRLTDKNSKASEEETQVKLELNSYEAENEEIHGPLADKVSKQNKRYSTLVDLELDIDDIRKNRNIIVYEKKARAPDDDTLSQDRVNNLKGKFESPRITLKDNCKMVQPTQSGIRQLRYRTVTTKDFISDMNDKYSRYTKDKTINTMLKKLEYTLMIATKRIEEMEENMVNNMDDDIEAKIPDSSKRRNFQEIPPQSRTMGNIVPDFKPSTCIHKELRFQQHIQEQMKLRIHPQKITQQKRTTHSYLSMPGLEELTIPIMVVSTSKRKISTKSREEMMEMEILQTMRTQMIIMMTKKVEMKMLRMLMDTYYQETALTNKPLLSQQFISHELRFLNNFPGREQKFLLFTQKNSTGMEKEPN